MEHEYKYKYAGKEFSWVELIDFLINLEEAEEKKKRWWKRVEISKNSFSRGLIIGMVYGSNIIAGVHKECDDYNINKINTTGSKPEANK